MAYTIPVAALIVDERAAAATLNLPADHFENTGAHHIDSEVDALAQITGAPIETFSDENGDIFYIGLQIEEDWRIDIDAALASKAAALKAQYPHPLVQSAQLAVVSQFC